jgi:hypothetical protein
MAFHVAVYEATSEEDFAAFGSLVRQYTQWCAHRYIDYPGIVDMAFNHQSLDAELNDLTRPSKARRKPSVISGERVRKPTIPV